MSCSSLTSMKVLYVLLKTKDALTKAKYMQILCTSCFYRISLSTAIFDDRSFQPNALQQGSNFCRNSHFSILLQLIRRPSTRGASQDCSLNSNPRDFFCQIQCVFESSNSATNACLNPAILQRHSCPSKVIHDSSLRT